MYHFKYTEKFNSKTLVHLEWDSETDADFGAMYSYFRSIVRALREGGVAVDTIGNSTSVCGYCANCGPSEGDVLTKVLRMENKI